MKDDTASSSTARTPSSDRYSQCVDMQGLLASHRRRETGSDPWCSPIGARTRDRAAQFGIGMGRISMPTRSVGQDEVARRGIQSSCGKVFAVRTLLPSAVVADYSPEHSRMPKIGEHWGIWSIDGTCPAEHNELF